MKKILLFLLVMVVAFAGCRKDNPEPNDGMAEVSFTFTKGLDLKEDVPDFDYGCYDVEGDYAFVRINGVDYTLDVFYLDGIPYTQTIKLDPGSYDVQEFMLMHDNNTPGVTSDDYALMATPHANAEWSEYVNQAIDISFSVIDFDKLELAIEVLCYEEQFYDYFGFVYFEFYEIIVREACFFGDICIKGLTDYEGSLYEDQPQGLQYDMPAIFTIEVWRGDDPENLSFVEEFNNELDADGNSWLGVGEPLCVRYADRLQEEDYFEFKLKIYVDDGDSWSYKYFHSWTFTDIIPASWDVEEDGVIDFALGSCVVDPDFAFMPYMDLPDECGLKIPNSSYPAPGSLGTYVDIILTGIPSGYDLYNDTWPGWCIEEDVNIYVGQQYYMYVYSSLYPVPPTADYDWDKINWLVNNLDWYEDDAAYAWNVLQQAFWKIANEDINFISSEISDGGAAGQTLAEQMYTDANNYGDGFIPLPGYWAAVIFVDKTNPYIVQVVFVLVDP